MSNSLMQLLLGLNIFLIGAATAVAIRHAYAHFRPDVHDAEKTHHAIHTVKLPPAIRQQLLDDAQKNFRKILDQTASQLQLDLSRTSAALNKQLEKLGNEIVSDEMKRYKTSLDELQRNTEVAISSTQNQLTQHQEDLKITLAERHAELTTKMEQEVAAEKARLIEQIDTKLADATASFLLETMQHNVDLGAQTAYLTTMIEEHKDDFKKDIADEALAAK